MDKENRDEMINFDSLNQIHVDVLKEIGNIGLGNAIGSLSQLIGKPVKMTVPEVKILGFKDVGSIIGGDEVVIFGILVALSGDINGMMMFLIKPDSARVMIDRMLGGMTNSTTDEFNELDISALQEIGNILCSSYLGSMSQLLNKQVTPTPPVIALDMATAILSVPAIEFGKMSDGVLFIDTIFDTDGEKISGFFLLVPDMESFRLILETLGVL